MNRVPVFVKTWAGGNSYDYAYIRRSLSSLLASDLPPEVRVVIADDHSTDPRAVRFLEKLSRGDPRVTLWVNENRLGPNGSQAYNFPRLVEEFPDAQVYLNCDDDVIYHPGWLNRLLQVVAEARGLGLTGIFSAFNSPFRPALRTVELPTSTLLVKKKHAAMNWLVPKEVYRKVGPFRDIGVAFDTDYFERMRALEVELFCMAPSWVQNIGYHGAYQFDNSERALDFVGRRPLSVAVADLGFYLRRHAEDLPEPVKRILRPVSRAIRAPGSNG